MASIGLVLGAGGLAGHAYEAGVLAALCERTGWNPNNANIIVGTSAGAGVAAYVRSGLSAADLYRRATGLTMSPAGTFLLAGIERPTPIPQRPGDQPRRMPLPAAPKLLASDLMRPWRIRAGRLLAAGLPEGRTPSDLIGDRVRRVLGTTWPERATWICVLRLSDGERVVLGRDAHPPIDLGIAVQASSAIPGYFVPVVVDGERYIDGGTHSPTNADVLVGAGLDVVVIIAPMSVDKARGAFDARVAGRLWHKATLANEVRLLRKDGARVVVFEPSPADVRAIGVNSLDHTRMGRVATSARTSAFELITDDVTRLLAAASPAR
jgi:NTE family protein